MIFVTLGTQDKKFDRLLEAVQKQINNGNICDKVVVQAGHTKFETNDMEIYDLLSMDDFDKYMSECDILITHGGVGSIIKGLNHDKKIIAAARLSCYGEHQNDHQLQIIDNFCKSGYLLKLDDFDELGILVKEIEEFNPKKFVSNTENFVLKLKEYIDNN